MLRLTRNVDNRRLQHKTRPLKLTKKLSKKFDTSPLYPPTLDKNKLWSHLPGLAEFPLISQLGTSARMTCTASWGTPAENSGMAGGKWVSSIWEDSQTDSEVNWRQLSGGGGVRGGGGGWRQGSVMLPAASSGCDSCLDPSSKHLHRLRRGLPAKLLNSDTHLKVSTDMGPRDR